LGVTVIVDVSLAVDFERSVFTSYDTLAAQVVHHIPGLIYSGPQSPADGRKSGTVPDAAAMVARLFAATRLAQIKARKQL
jgi:hypothetical protein